MIILFVCFKYYGTFLKHSNFCKSSKLSIIVFRILHRNDAQNEENEIDPWGQGQPTKRPKPSSNRPLTPTEIENMVLKAEKEALVSNFMNFLPGIH